MSPHGRLLVVGIEAPLLGPRKIQSYFAAAGIPQPLSAHARARIEPRSPRLKAWPFLGITFMQAFLLAAHWFIYRTFIDFWPSLSPAALVALRSALLLLGFSLSPRPCWASASIARRSSFSTGWRPSGWVSSTTFSCPPACVCSRVLLVFLPDSSPTGLSLPLCSSASDCLPVSMAC